MWSVLALLYCYCVPVGTPGAIDLGAYAVGGFTLMPECNGFPLFACLIVCVIWFFSITFGRLYLGAHSPTDVRGGIILGIALGLFWWYLGDHYDELTLFVPQLGAIVLVLSWVIIMLSPQPRPMTPTFLQNCLLVGLQAGCTLGFRSEFERRAAATAEGAAAASGNVISPEDMYSWRSHGLRIIIGYALVLVVRQVNKTLLTILLRVVFGIDPSPVGKLKLKVDNPTKDKDEESDDEGEDDPWGQHVPLDKYVPRVLEGWDLCGAALVKFCGYMMVAWLITSGCPQLFEAFGLGTDLRLKA